MLKETLEAVKCKNSHLEKEMWQISSNYKKLAQQIQSLEYQLSAQVSLASVDESDNELVSTSKKTKKDN